MLISVCCLSFGSINSNCTQHYCTSYFVWQCTQQSQCNSFYVTSHGGGGVVAKKFIKGALCTGHNTFNQNVQEFGWLNYQPLCGKMSPHLFPDLRRRSKKEFCPKLVSRQVLFQEENLINLPALSQICRLILSRTERVSSLIYYPTLTQFVSRIFYSKKRPAKNLRIFCFQKDIEII